MIKVKTISGFWDSARVSYLTNGSAALYPCLICLPEEVKKFYQLVYSSRFYVYYVLGSIN